MKPTCNIGEHTETREVPADVVFTPFFNQTAAYPHLEVLIGRQAECLCHEGSQIQKSHFRCSVDLEEIFRVSLWEYNPETDRGRRSLHDDEFQRRN